MRIRNCIKINQIIGTGTTTLVLPYPVTKVQHMIIIPNYWVDFEGYSYFILILRHWGKKLENAQIRTMISF